MNEKHLLYAVAGLSALAGVTACDGPSGKNAAGKKLNIVYIMCDDHS